MRVVPPGTSHDGIVLDLLFASSGIEPELVAAAEPLEVWPALCVPVPRVGHLLALKVLARDDVRRPQDLADIRSLRTCRPTGLRSWARRWMRFVSDERP